MTMTFAPPSEVQRIRESLDHPVIDADGHLIEYLPDLRDRIREFGGSSVVNRFDRHFWTMDQGMRLPPAVRRRFGIPRPAWWTYQARNTLDRASAMLPRLMYERLPEIGIDFAIAYPSYFIQFPVAEDSDFRRAGCRAVNSYLAETYAELSDRITPAATIPMHTPEEALDELRFAHERLELKVVVMQGIVLRRLPSSDRVWVDALGLESEHDYDQVWRYCEDHGIAPTFHSSGMGWGSRNSVTNFMHNHIGHFAAAGDATARSLLFAGVPVRFPRLRFAFLEGGVAWGAALYSQFSGNFEKRNRRAIDHYNPRHLDVSLVESLLTQYGTEPMRAHADELEHALVPLSAPVEEVPDEFAASGFRSVEHIAEVFATSMFFGCEGDDPMNAVAAERFYRPLGTRLNALYGSDVGHWDVPDIREVLTEAYEPVEEGVLTPADFRRMVFESPVRLWTDNNPKFFEGTAIADAVADFQRTAEDAR